MLSQSSPVLQVFVFLLLSYSTGSYCPANYDCPCGRVSGNPNRNTIHLTELVPCYNKSLASPRRCDSFIYVAALDSLRYIATNLSLITNCCFGFIRDIPKYDNPYEVSKQFPLSFCTIYNIICKMSFFSRKHFQEQLVRYMMRLMPT